jgi:hypothetical protein
VNAAGEAETRAGVHPDRFLQTFKLPESSEYVREVFINLPAGLGGDGAAVPLCPMAQVHDFDGRCPAESQIGVLRGGPEPAGIYSVEPGPNEAVLFAATSFATLTPQIFTGHLRPDDQGLTLFIGPIEHFPLFDSKLEEAEIELWGIPADHQVGTSIPRKALLTTPTRCDAPPLATTVTARTWEQPDVWLSVSADTGHRLVGCGDLSFEPRLDFAIDDNRADTLSGARIDVMVPQNAGPDGRASSQIRDLAVTMPAGMGFSPGGATGLRACADAEFGLGTAADPSCPAASRVGTVELSVPSLGEPTRGPIYLGQERPGDRFRLFVSASAAGSAIKLVGSLSSDPATGRLTAILKDLPQASFNSMSLRFDSALLATPLSCGLAETTAKVTPYSGTPPVNTVSATTLAETEGRACAGAAPFGPTFTAGSTQARAGRPTSFTATLSRRDGEQLPERMSITLPAGISAALGTIPPCSAAAIANLTCAAASRIGGALAELGPGTAPAQLGGDIFLTGPYRQAPFGFAVVFRGAVGPFDLGNLVVRGTMQMDRLSGRVTIATDPMPMVVEGLPIRFQTLGLDLDRPDFMRNPTSCAPASVSAALRSQSGAIVRPSTPFALGGCVDLPFHPAVSVTLSGKAEMRKEGKPGLRMAMRIPPGNANLRSVDIRLPKLFGFDPAALKEICARGRAERGNCSKNSNVGFASGRSPLLSEAMKGSIYVVQPKGGGTPDIWASLGSQGLQVDLRGETTTEKGHIEFRFPKAPDFPFKNFTLGFAGGQGGLLELKGSPCAGVVAPMELAAQNGDRAELRTRLTAPAGCDREGKSGGRRSS